MKKILLWIKNRVLAIALLYIVTLTIYVLIYYAFVLFEQKPVISPCPDSGCEVTVLEQTLVPTPRVVTYRGIASYYSREGCVGCREDRLMANGKPLDDSKLTAAYNRAPLGTIITVTNPEAGKSAQIVVTDRGGFERLGRIIDLSVASKSAINCKDLCTVEIAY